MLPQETIQLNNIHYKILAGRTYSANQNVDIVTVHICTKTVQAINATYC